VCEETCPGTVDVVVKELRQILYEFDSYWVDFEYLYVMELMLIENDARRYVTEAIKIEKEMVLQEIREKAKGRVVLDCEDYNDLRTNIVDVIGKINSVANVDGKGRDDLTVDILIAAEGLSRRMSSG